jgi:sec-independent protein translocase protein TatB
MGPERLPEAIRAISLWIGRLKQLLAQTRQEIENEVGMDDIRHQLHNEQVLKELGEHKDQLEQSLDNHKTGQP